MKNLFVYGSLLFPEILEGLTGKLFKTSDAILHGFKRYAVKGADYPAIVENTSSKVKGKIVSGVDEKSMQTITYYEGDQYDIVPLKIVFENDVIETFVFVWNLEQDDLETQDWDAKRFEQESLPYYLTEVVPETVEEFRRIDFRASLG
ncbi:gamma-glutamylcyclotransferase [Prolixibacteraceae bacterium Z1-6]|uniref:Putative gamma-glutamylcyclotransferase n=1 Tax=Draconibacterium aestuarii TaxID=2998507 RepID=A0A9X3FCK4_9BACT|nr:gamma-glutamylcyclotransferase [Prolixibacteraceae bacterium Z1-6]